MTDYTWDNNSSGVWEDPFQWYPYSSLSPGENDNATVSGSTSTSLYILQNDAAAGFYLENPNASVNDAGEPADLNVGSEYYQDTGQFNLYNDGELEIDSGAAAYLVGGQMNVYSPGILFNAGTVYQDGTSMYVQGSLVQRGVLVCR